MLGGVNEDADPQTHAFHPQHLVCNSVERSYLGLLRQTTVGS